MKQPISRYIIQQSSINFITNAFFNGVICWLLLRGGPGLTLWGEHSFAVDLIATAFILLFIVTVIVIPLQRRKRKKGELDCIQWNTEKPLHRLLARFPASPWRCGILFGLIGIFIFIPATLVPMIILSVNEFGVSGYALFKGLWAGALAGLTMGPMILIALAEPCPAPQTIPEAIPKPTPDPK